ncbi:MAG: helix-turn-helix transcriptional regulator [Prevotella sp.]
MRHDKLEKELYVLELLTENHTYDIQQICDKLGMSRRNLYYYIEFFRDNGFNIYKQGNCYCIDRDSPFFDRLIQRISFTEEEAITIRRAISRYGKGNAIIGNIKKKLDRFYDFDILAEEQLDEESLKKVTRIYNAIKLKRQIFIRNYTSPHSNSTKDRLVEPFNLMNNNHEVRCFEPLSGMNKTFKISRMADVEILDTEWIYENRHKTMHTDIFMFSSETTYHIQLILGRLSCNILKEEYPLSEQYIKPIDNEKFRLEMDVCSYTGIGRFIIGLFDDIEIIGDEGLIDYLKVKIDKLCLF